MLRASSASGFQTGVDTLDALLCQPLTQLLKACCSIWKDFMTEGAAWVDEAHIELEFCDVDAERR